MTEMGPGTLSTSTSKFRRTSIQVQSTVFVFTYSFPDIDNNDIFSIFYMSLN